MSVDHLAVDELALEVGSDEVDTTHTLRTRQPLRAAYAKRARAEE